MEKFLRDRYYIYKENIKGVEFKTEIWCTITGSINVLAYIKNTNMTGKLQVQTIVDVKNEDDLIDIIYTDPVAIYGSISRLFSIKPTKLSKSLMKTINLDNIELRHPEKIQPYIRDIDTQITETGKELKKAKILGLSDQITELELDLKELKKVRSTNIQQKSLFIKFNSLNFDVHHIVSNE